MTKMKHLILFCLFFVRNCLGEEREPKFFFGPKMQTVVSYKRIPEFVTEFVPSSCIVIEPTLPPCRHVRSLEIYPSVPTRILKTQTPQIQNRDTSEDLNWKPIVQTSETVHHQPTPPLKVRPQQGKNPSSHWNWNIFSNFFRVDNITYTTTKTQYITTKVEDPNTVVSFYVRGCRPSRLPFNLPECVKPQEVKKDENIVLMAPLKFVPSGSLIIPSKPENVTKIKEKEAKEEQAKQEEEREKQEEEREKQEEEQGKQEVEQGKQEEEPEEHEEEQNVSENKPTESNK